MKTLRPTSLAMQASSCLPLLTQSTQSMKAATALMFSLHVFQVFEMKVGVLFSGGKDSTFSTYIAQLYGWDVSCLISLKSLNKDSFMFHTPNIDLVSLQAKAMELPLILKETSGEKEMELEDLKLALATAKMRHEIEGVVVGALFSDYQQERVNRICYALDLKTFAPLWHVPQDKLLKEMIDLGFELQFSAIAAYGLDKSYLGKTIDDNVYEKLLKLHEKVGFHVAGEGGEYETLVVDCPLFKKKLVVKDASVVMENENTGKFVVKRAVLQQKA